MDLYIDESGMRFGPYQQEKCFHIEKSDFYKKRCNNLKIAEFLLLRTTSGRNSIYIVEAKSSAPRVPSAPMYEDILQKIRKKPSREDVFLADVGDVAFEHTAFLKEMRGHILFADYLKDIMEKFSNTLSLFTALKMQRHSCDESEIASELREIALSNSQFTCILVINGFKKGYLPPLQDCFTKTFQNIKRSWGQSTDVVVMNHEIALERNLIRENNPAVPMRDIPHTV